MPAADNVRVAVTGAVYYAATGTALPTNATTALNASFLANDVGISVLPSVAALRDLRAVAGRSAAPEPFLAFADPAFAGDQKDRRSLGAVANTCRQGAGIDVREVPLTKHDVYIADECFLTGTAAEVVPVVKVDSRTIGTGKPGPITRDLEKRFKKLTQL